MSKTTSAVAKSAKVAPAIKANKIPKAAKAPVVPETPHLEVPIGATVAHNVFESLVAQAENCVVEVVNEHIASSFEAELAALQAKHGFSGNVKILKAKAPKAPKAPKIEQNGITRPAPGTTCGLIWAVADNHTTPNQPAQIAAVRGDALLKDVNDHTIKTQYARWRQFNGVVGRLSTPTAKPVQGEDSGLVALH